MNARTACLPLACLAIAACGGDDGDNNSGFPQPDSSSFKITADNAAPSMRASWRAANESADMADLAVTSGLISASPTGASKPDSGVNATMSLLNYVQKVPFGPETMPCQVAGSVTLSGEVANPTTLTAGDFVAVDADNCDDGLGEVIDGLLDMSIDGFSGDLLSGAYELTMTLELDNFQVTTADDVRTGNGDVTVTLNTLSLPTVAAAVSGNSMTTDANSASHSLAGYSSTRTLDAGQSPAPWSLTSAGSLESTELPAGSVSYSTPVTFEGLGAAFPHAGELLVEGDASSARLVAVDDTNVRIEVDTDGDGAADTVIETTWAEIAG